MGSSSQQFYSLSWSEFGSSLTSSVELLRGHGDLVDVTLAAGGRSFAAHKIVLSAASPFLLDILKNAQCQHPVIMLAGISANDLESILEFIYRGELSVEQSQLPSLLQAAQCLSIHGLPPSIVMSQKGNEIPLSAISGCNDPSIARDTMNSYLAQRRRKKKRKQEGGGGKWPRVYSIDSRLDSHSEENRSLDYGHKDGDDNSEVKRRVEHANHHIGSPLPQHQLVHPVVEHNAGTALITDSEAEPHLHNLMPMQPYSPLHIPQFPGAIQSMSYPASAVAAAASVGVAAAAASVSTPSGTSTPHSNSSSATPSQSSTGAKIRGASDCPGVCPLCGATLRQARNLRRHLLSSCKYRFTSNPNQQQQQQQQQHQMMPADSMSIEVKPDVSVSGYGSGGAGSQGSAESASSSCEQIVCNPSPLPSPSPQGEWNSKSRTLSDQPATCPLCGAMIRQSRNLRRHLELLHFGAGSGKTGTKSKKEKSDKGFTPRSSAYSKASLTALRESMQAKTNSTSYTSMPSLNLSTSSSAPTISVPRSSALASNSHHLHHHPHPAHAHAHGHAHGHHTTPNTNPAHTIPVVPHPPSSLPPPTNGIYSSEGASMLSTLFPTLPTLPISSPHDMFRHTEFLRANMGYTQDPARQQHANRHLQRTDVT